MTLQLTPDILEACYEYLRVTAPFNRCRLPDPDDLEFRVTRHNDRFGHFDDRDGKHPFPNISISEKFVKTTLGLAEVMSHELVHVALFVRGDAGWEKHGASFKRMAKAVCRHHGFDPKTF